MPDRLPVHLVIRRFAQQSFYAGLFLLRAALVTTVWLGMLPWITISTWRVYFAMGEST
jgi:E3 ubiquitin-protein ligase MARCH6